MFGNTGQTREETALAQPHQDRLDLVIQGVGGQDRSKTVPLGELFETTVPQRTAGLLEGESLGFCQSPHLDAFEIQGPAEGSAQRRREGLVRRYLWTQPVVHVDDGQVAIAESVEEVRQDRGILAPGEGQQRSTPLGGAGVSTQTAGDPFEDGFFPRARAWGGTCSRHVGLIPQARWEEDGFFCLHGEVGTCTLSPLFRGLLYRTGVQLRTSRSIALTIGGGRKNVTPREVGRG